MKAELARCAPRKSIWFLAPKGILSCQQHDVIVKNLPGYQSRLFLGSDNVQYWSTQKIWDDLLKNIRIVVSTPQILLDALGSGFVNINQVALIVIDEGVIQIGPA